MNYSGFLCVENALRGIPNQRIPCFPLIDAAFASSFNGRSLRVIQTDPERHAEALTRCVRELPVDGVYINLALASGQGKQLDEKSFLLDEAITVVVPENDVLSIAETTILTLDDPRITTAELFHPGMLQTFKRMPKDVKTEYAVAVGLTGTFSQLAFLFGVQNLLTALIDFPVQVTQALEQRHQTVLRQIDELCDSGVRLVWIGEGLGSGSLISPEQYGEFVLPYEQDIARRLRDRGVLSLLHICGNTGNALHLIAQSGVDGFDLDYPVDIESAIEAFASNITVKGNINPALFLPGRGRELKNAVKDILFRAGSSTRFIPSSGCLVPRDSEKEAFYTMWTECNKTIKADTHD